VDDRTTKLQRSLDVRFLLDLGKNFMFSVYLLSLSDRLASSDPEFQG